MTAEDGFFLQQFDHDGVIARIARNELRALHDIVLQRITKTDEEAYDRTHEAAGTGGIVSVRLGIFASFLFFLLSLMIAGFL